MSIMIRRFTILALTSLLFAIGMASAVTNMRPAANRYQPLTICSAVSGYKCL